MAIKDNVKRTRVAIVYRVCQHWRVPIFRKLNEINGIEVKVFYSKGVPGSKLVNGREISGFSARELPTVGGEIKISGRRSPFVVCPTLFIELAKYNPDVLIVEGGSNLPNNIFVYAYALLYKKPVIWWTLGELPGRKYSKAGMIYRWLVEEMERSSSALLGYSSVAVDYFKRKGYPEEKCFRAVNCVDTDKVMSDIGSTKHLVPLLRDQYDLKNKKVVLFVGALTKPKRIDRLLHAFAEVKHEVPDSTLLIVGDGPERAALESTAERIHIADSTIFTGEIVDDVAAYYQLGDVFVLPGLGGLAISEAMTHALPVICGQGDGCEVDLVQSGISGFRFEESTDPEVISQIASWLCLLLKNPDVRETMAENSRLIIASTHNIRSYMANIVAALKYAENRTKVSY